MKKWSHLVLSMLITIFTYANTEFDGLKLRSAGYENKLTISDINSTTVYETDGKVEQNIKVIFNTNWEGLYVEATSGTRITSDLYKSYIKSIITPELIKSNIVPEIDESTPKKYNLESTTHQGIDITFDQSKLEGFIIKEGKLSEHTNSNTVENSKDKYDVVFLIGLNHLDTEKTGVDNVQKHLKTFMMSDLASTSFNRINIVEYGAIKFQPNLDMGDRYIPFDSSIGKLDENSNQANFGNRFFYKNGYYYDLDKAPKDYFKVKELVLRDFNSVTATVNGEYILKNQILGDKNGNSYRLRMYDDWITTSSTDNVALTKALNHVGLLASNRGSYGTEGGTNTAHGLYYAAKFLVEKSLGINQRLIILSDSQVMAPTSFDLVRNFPEFSPYLNNFSKREIDFINSNNPSATLKTQRENAFAFYNWLGDYTKTNNILLLASIPLTDINSDLDSLNSNSSENTTDRLGNPYTDIWDTNNVGNIFHPLMLKSYMGDMFYEYESSSKNITDYKNQSHLNDILNHFFGIARFNQSWQFEYTVSQVTNNYFDWKKSIFSLGNFTIPGTTDTAITRTKLVKPATTTEHIEGYRDRYYLPKEGKYNINFVNPDESRNGEISKFVRKEPVKNVDGTYTSGDLVLIADITHQSGSTKIDENSVDFSEFIIDFDFINPNSTKKFSVNNQDGKKIFISNYGSGVRLEYTLTPSDIDTLKRYIDNDRTPKKARFTVNATTLKSGVKNNLEARVEAMVYLGEPQINKVVATNITAKKKLEVLKKWDNTPVFDFGEYGKDLTLIQATSSSSILYVNGETSTNDNRDEVEIKIDFDKRSISAETFKIIGNKVNLTNTIVDYTNGTITGQINQIVPDNSQIDYTLISAQHIKDDYNNIATNTPTLAIQILTRPNPISITGLSRDNYKGAEIIINGLDNSYDLQFKAPAYTETIAGTILLFQQEASPEEHNITPQVLGSQAVDVLYVTDHINLTSGGAFSMPTKSLQRGSAYVHYDGIYQVGNMALVNRAGMFSGLSDDKPSSYSALDLGTTRNSIEYLVDTLGPTPNKYTKIKSLIKTNKVIIENNIINTDIKKYLDNLLGINLEKESTEVQLAKYFTDNINNMDKYKIGLKDASYTYLSTTGSIIVTINSKDNEGKFIVTLIDSAGNPSTNSAISIIDETIVDSYTVNDTKAITPKKISKNINIDNSAKAFFTNDTKVKVISNNAPIIAHGTSGSNSLIGLDLIQLGGEGRNTFDIYLIHESGYARVKTTPIVRDDDINFSGFSGTFVAKEINGNRAEITIDFGLVTEYAGLAEVIPISNSTRTVNIDERKFLTYGSKGTSPSPTSNKLIVGSPTRTFTLNYSNSVPSSDTLKVMLKDNLGNERSFSIPIIISTTNIIGTRKDVNRKIESSFTIKNDGTMSITSQEQKGSN